METRASTELVYVALRFSNLSYGDVDSNGEVVVIGIRPSELESLVKRNLKKMNVKTVILPEYHSPNELRFSLPASELGSSPKTFFDIFVREIESDLSIRGFSTRVQYELFNGRAPWVISGGSTGGGGTTSDKIAPEGDLSKAVFNSASRLTKQQWQKVEKALENINNDCLGGRLIGEVKSLGIKIVYNQSITPNGLYSHQYKRLTIKSFEDSEDGKYNLERGLFHELIHSLQSGDTLSKMNQEIEVRIATYMYCKKYSIALGGSYTGIEAFGDIIDPINYNITDTEIYDEIYSGYMKKLENDAFYKNYRDAPSERRNLKTIQELAKDCK